MDFPGLRRHLQSLYTDPQVLARLAHGLDQVEEGLKMLAANGHLFHLAPGAGPKWPEWPRLMYHLTSAPNGRWVRSEFELWDLGDGWCDSLAEAQIRDGYAQQMKGRGGVNRRSLPVPVAGGETMDEGAAMVAALKKEFEQGRAFGLAHGNGKGE